MATSSLFRLSLAAGLSSLLICLPAHGLVSLNDGRNQIYVAATVDFGWDSNVFANQLSGGDYLTTAGVSVELKRRAGLISVDGSIGLDAIRFNDNTGQNAVTQVKAFDDALGVTGLALTKLAGTAKGGAIAAIAQARPIPVRYIGVGETVDDLRPFDAREFVEAIFPV